MPLHLFRIVRRRRVNRRRRRTPLNTKEFILNKEMARTLVMERLAHFVAEYTRIDPTIGVAMKYNRVSIRNQRGRWGSCSSKKNLNFNYRIINLSPELRDYVIVHELCHLKELNHSKACWDLVEKIVPEGRRLNEVVKRMKMGEVS